MDRILYEKAPHRDAIRPPRPFLRGCAGSQQTLLRVMSSMSFACAFLGQHVQSPFQEHTHFNLLLTAGQYNSAQWLSESQEVSLSPVARTAHKQLIFLSVRCHIVNTSLIIMAWLYWFWGGFSSMLGSVLNCLLVIIPIPLFFIQKDPSSTLNWL